MKGDMRVDILMIPVLRALEKHVKDEDAKTEIYNRAYEAILISMNVKQSSNSDGSATQNNPDFNNH